MMRRFLVAGTLFLALFLLAGCTSTAQPPTAAAPAASLAAAASSAAGTPSSPSGATALTPPASPSAAPSAPGVSLSPAAGGTPSAAATRAATPMVLMPAQPTPTVTPNATFTPLATSTAAPTATAAATVAASAQLPPPSGFRIRIPAVGVDAPIVSVGLEPDGSMAAPNGPDMVGWYSPGARPGGPGNALLDGHVDWADRQTGVARTAVFYPLKDVRAGQDIIVDVDGRRHTYKVRDALVFAWDDPSALKVLQPSNEALITLITCEGTFDRGQHNYSHRRVLIAALASSE
ncbi:MAG: class F sortase [Chloroflexi bacterium]|nr:class F sortase [Chloroflexota bacterium]